MKTKTDRRPTKTYFLAGDFNVFDDMTGFKRKASECLERWDKMIMPAHLFEERHPQDFLRGKKETIGTPWARPELTDKFGQTSAEDL